MRPIHAIISYAAAKASNAQSKALNFTQSDVTEIIFDLIFDEFFRKHGQNKIEQKQTNGKEFMANLKAIDELPNSKGFRFDNVRAGHPLASFANEIVRCLNAFRDLNSNDNWQQFAARLNGLTEFKLENKSFQFYQNLMTNAENAGFLADLDKFSVREPTPHVHRTIKKAIMVEATTSTFQEFCAKYLGTIGIEFENNPTMKVYYGPPGTGKTRYTTIESARIFGLSTNSEPKAKAEVQKNSDRVVRTQFHPGYAYEDFVEGFRPIIRGKNIVSYEIVDGPFVAACSIARNAIHLPLENGEVLEWARNLYNIQSLDAIKTLCFLTLNKNAPSIDQSKPDLKEVSAVYYRPLDTSLENKLVPVVLIIDEINRGDSAKIFGEMLTAVEPSYRSVPDERPSFFITLQHSKRKFNVPANLHILATMNTADRSLASMDQAFRRRFEFVGISPRLEVVKQFASDQMRSIRAESETGRQRQADIDKVVSERNVTLTEVRQICSDLATVFDEINSKIEDDNRRFGQSFALKAIDNAITASKRGAPYWDCIRVEVARMWLFEILPQLRLIPGLSMNEPECPLFELIESKNSACGKLIRSIHGEKRQSVSAADYWRSTNCFFSNGSSVDDANQINPAALSELLKAS